MSSKELEAARELVKMLEKKEKAEKVELSTLNPGEVFKIGKHDFLVHEDTRDYNKSSIKQLIENEIQPIIEKRGWS